LGSQTLTPEGMLLVGVGTPSPVIRFVNSAVATKVNDAVVKSVRSEMAERLPDGDAVVHSRAATLGEYSEEVGDPEPTTDGENMMACAPTRCRRWWRRWCE
jgi:hypothetical protein